MNARELTSLLRFVGGRPMLILRDHDALRIRVYERGVWIFTVGEGRALGVQQEAFLLGVEAADMGHHEERSTWGGIAHALSMYQQHGEVPCMDEDGFEESFE